MAKLRGVVTASTTMLNQTVNAAGSFLVNTVNHSTALARAVNQADGQFFASVITAETAALDAAFDLRAAYEKKINEADRLVPECAVAHFGILTTQPPVFGPRTSP